MEWPRGDLPSACRGHPMHSCASGDVLRDHRMHSCASRDRAGTSLQAQSVHRRTRMGVLPCTAVHRRTVRGCHSGYSCALADATECPSPVRLCMGGQGEVVIRTQLRIVAPTRTSLHAQLCMVGQRGDATSDTAVHGLTRKGQDGGKKKAANRRRTIGSSADEGPWPAPDRPLDQDSDRHPPESGPDRHPRDQRIAMQMKSRMNSAETIQIIGWTSLALPLQVFTMQYVMNPPAMP